MIKNIIGRLTKIDNRAKPGDWRDEATLKFFGVEERPNLTARDMMDQDSINKKRLEVQEWKERRDAYEKFTGKKWR